MYVDSHCHLNFPELNIDIFNILKRMHENAVLAALCVSTNLEKFPDVHRIALEHEHIWATVGVHPDYADVTEPSESDLVDRAQLAKIVAIGETGLDYCRLEDQDPGCMARQKDRFRCHIRAAVSTKLPLVIHTRNAASDTLAILREEGASRVGGVFHCFTETMDFAKQVLDLGFYISFSGILTFKNATALQAVAKYIPLNRCLIETDSPYLAPVPHRGKVNTPAFVPLVAAKLAALKGAEVEEVAAATTHNFYQCFPATLNSVGATGNCVDKHRA